MVLFHYTHLSNEVLEGAPGNLGVPTLDGLGEVSTEYAHAHTKVRLIEIIRHIPADLQRRRRRKELSLKMD